MIRLLCIPFLFLLLPIWAQEKTAVSLEKIAENISMQRLVFPQEKIHIHTDRSAYFTGDKIWFKAYLTAASDFKLIPSSRYIYVELISPTDSLVHRIKIKPENNLHYGHINIPIRLTPGNYTLYAYTKNMQNLGDDYFFRKQIKIGEPLEKTQTKRNAVDYQVSVFPEGGYLLEGALCRVAFKALNEKGLGEDIIEAELTDDTGGVVRSEISSTHLGMGVFSFTPESGKQYILNCKSKEGVWQNVKLPSAKTNQCGIVANWRNDQKLAVGLLKASAWKESPLFLLIHQGGTIQYASEWQQNKPYILLPKEALPEGILHILLLNNDGNIVSERLVFCKQETQTPQCLFSTDRKEYATRDLVSATLHLSEADGTPLQGHFSVAVTDNNAMSVDHHTSIQASLLLTSELKGYIENPGYYFLNESLQVENALDQLLMTQGWRRYDIPEVVKGKITYPQHQSELTSSISGRISDLVFSKCPKDAQVALLSPRDSLYVLLKLDDAGYFKYTGFEYPDSCEFNLQGYTRKGTDRLRIYVDKDTFPVNKWSPAGLFSQKTKQDTDTLVNTLYQNARYDESGMRIVDLPEVVTTAIAKKKEEQRSIFSISATNIITREDIETYKQPNLRMILQYMQGKGIRSVGSDTIILSGRPDGPALIMLDGIITEGLNFDMIPNSQVEQVEIIAPYKGALFGSKGRGGAVNIITRYEADDKPQFNTAMLKPLGYQKPIAFYAPIYETESQRKRPEIDYRTTLYWNPTLLPDALGKATFQFYTSDASSHAYSVVIEGITTTGKLIRKVEEIQLKKSGQATE